MLVFTFPAAEFAEDLLPPDSLWLTIWGSYSMIAVSYIFLLLLFIDLGLLLNNRGISFVPRAIKEHKRTPFILSGLIVGTVIVVLIYGSWNARNPVVTNYALDIEKKAGSLKQLKVVMISDIHYGKIINEPRLNPMVEMTNKLQPDIILLAGDIMDGNIDPADVRRLTAVLSLMQAKYGTFAVPGNHDRGLRDNQLLNDFEEAGVKVLKDNYIKVDDSFYIIGRDDPGRRTGKGRKELGELMKGIDASLPLILLDHQPIDLINAQAVGVDLQLSGHTNRGQIFPSNFITGQIYELDWGPLKKESYHLVVSSGYGTWGPPLRIGSNSEIVNIKMNFQ
ncbi:metallophosphoesterase [Desulforamulus ruminis]|uniref:metallophosphoesterase n=1 Tax=Desulforamulus ruminis TaxID=1564 RepID=UPI001EE45425|nr:metallophosphoesterase [Desulforamulus ruminis]